MDSPCKGFFLLDGNWFNSYEVVGVKYGDDAGAATMLSFSNGDWWQTAMRPAYVMELIAEARDHNER